MAGHQEQDTLAHRADLHFGELVETGLEHRRLTESALDAM